MLFKSKFPQEDNELLENLTLQQYDHIFKALIENKDLKTIKKSLENNPMIFNNTHKYNVQI